MAKIKEEIIVIRLSQLLKNNQDDLEITNEEFTTSLEDIVQELVGEKVLVEIERN